jgi:hypothetical protein
MSYPRLEPKEGRLTIQEIKRIIEKVSKGDRVSGIAVRHILAQLELVT